MTEAITLKTASSLLRYTLWSTDDIFIEHINEEHIFRPVINAWNLVTRPGVLSTQLPGPMILGRNTADKSSKPMTDTINLVPIMFGSLADKVGDTIKYSTDFCFAMKFGDVRSMRTYEQWKLKVDSYPDYIATMVRRGRYVGRLQGGIG